MGMFDYVKCEMPLPDGTETPSDMFQTKDFDCDMEVYTITEKGRLIHHTVEYEHVPKSERPHPNDDGWMGIVGCIRSIQTGDVDINYHGFMFFYTIDANNEWREFKAKFTDGECVNIERISK